jgi:hypothetical protein
MTFSISKLIIFNIILQIFYASYKYEKNLKKFHEKKEILKNKRNI